jgi:hypothetical protein
MRSNCSGRTLQHLPGYLETMAIEMISFPINSMVIFHSYVSLPEGTLLVPIVCFMHFTTTDALSGLFCMSISSVEVW